MDPLLDDAPCGYLTFTDDGVIVAANRTLRSWLGYEEDELVGQHIGAILTPGGRIFYQTHLFPMITMHGSAEEIYVALRDREGGDVPVLVNGRRYEREGGLQNDLVLVPMRQRRRYEDELLRAKRAAEAASQAKAKFLSMMSHELRTPLHAISLYVEVLEEQVHGPLTAGQREDIERISSASGYLLGLIEDILNFARLEDGRVDVKTETVPVETALTRAEALVLNRAREAGLTYERADRASDLYVVADPLRLQQVLLNLLTNAIKFTPAGGRVETKFDLFGDRVCIAVRDTGPGIAADEIDRVFEPFYQAQRQSTALKAQGTGLGLTISRELVRAMGGELSVDSTVGQGSTFMVNLPRAN